MMYFMFHFGRSGSTVLTNCIGQSEDVFWHGEIFSRNVHIGSGFDGSQYKSKQGGGSFSLDEFIDYIKACKKYARPSEDIEYGCEIKSYHFELGLFKFTLDECLERLRVEFDCKFIFLERKNSLRRILSCLMANETNVWHKSSNNDNEISKKLTLDINALPDADLGFKSDLHSTLSHSEKVNRKYKESILEMQGMCLSYEFDLKSDVMIGVDKLSSFMNLPEYKPEVKYKKTNPQEISSLITNFIDVKKVLESSRFDWMLRD
ncbi:hypothetical protein P7F88_22335 [Vibrio hannami]|uniref:hypothetical protein n=1 Tax=Vibrio hannami TaxID=2717094 RepID=UPI0024104B41|nr:hypothetical protein [Vibrio hannami]MDG3088650.1 hypothetical protein [Vibrio hannami]